MRQTLSDIAYTFGAGFQIRSQLMGPLQYAHIRFMWNRKIFLISLPQQNTNFVTSTRARGISCKIFCNCVRPVRTRWRGIPWNCSLHETEWWWCVDYRRICAQDALWRCFMRVHQSHVSGVINRVTWPLCCAGGYHDVLNLAFVWYFATSTCA